MRKVQFTAVFWTLALAIPFTALALSGLAYVTEHLSQIANALVTFSQTTSAGGRGWMLELSERLPELAGMIVGQAVILTILLFARQANNARNASSHHR